MSDKTELLPCPFCGSTNLVKSPWIECDNCGAMGPSPRDCDNYSGEWNRRATLAQQPAQAVPDGYALVPIKPTYEMTVAYNVWGTDYPKDPLLKGPPRNLDHGAYSAMLAAAPAAPVAQGPATWVSVADRLPGEDSEVIVSGWAYNDPARGRFVTHADFSDGQFKPVGAANEYDALHPPTHWMPMPSAPGEAAPPASEQTADQAMPGVLELLRERRKLDGDARYLFGDDRVWAEKADAFLVSTAAEQPDTVAVRRKLLEDMHIAIADYVAGSRRSRLESLTRSKELRVAERRVWLAARALLAGGAE